MFRLPSSRRQVDLSAGGAGMGAGKATAAQAEPPRPLTHEHDDAAIKDMFKRKSDAVFTVLAERSEQVPERSGLVQFLEPAVDFGKTFPLGSAQRTDLLKFIRNLAQGEQEKDRYGELQVKAFPPTAHFLVSEMRDEAADSKCKDLAVEATRNFARNYPLKPRLFETEGFASVLFATIRQNCPATVHGLCLVLLTTLATDPVVAEGLVEHYPRDLQELLVRLLSSPYEKFTNTRMVSDVVLGVRLTQNLSQHDTCKTFLSSSTQIVDCLGKLTSAASPIISDADAVMQALMGLANVVGDDETKTDILQGSENGLLKLTTLLDKVINKREVHFTLETVLRPLRRLCPPDRNRQAMSPKLIPLMPLALEQAMTNEDRASAELAFSILSQLSFDDGNLEFLKKDSRIAAALTRISQLSSSGDSASAAKWVKVARSADVLKFNLQKKGEMLRRASFSNMGSVANLGKLVEEGEQSLKQSENQQVNLMISYQWKFQETAKLLALFLKQNPSISVWIDIQKMKAEVMQSMADAVSSSDYILVLVSETYKNSSACKCEAMYAFELKKPIIPVIVEKDYVAAGWLGALIAGKLRYDCCEPSKVSQEVPRLLHEVRPGASPNGTSSRRGSVAVKKNLQSVDDVSSWLAENGLERFVEAFQREQVDGDTLRAVRDDFSAFSQDLQQVFGMDFKTRILFRKVLNQI